MKCDVREDIKAEICALAKKNNIEKVILFGSRARGDNGEKSDIDLAAFGGDVINFTFDVDEETSTLLMFDVVNLNGRISDELQKEIDRDGIVLYEV